MPPGEIDFNKLNNVFIIIIMPFDLFGLGLYKYTFQMGCDEAPEVKLNDGAKRIFLNTHGTNPEGVSEELLELMHFIEKTEGRKESTYHSKKIQDMQMRIEAIKSSEEIGVKYMQEWEEKIIDKRKAREEGLAEGRAQGIAEGKEEGIMQGERQMLQSLIEKKRSRGKDIATIAAELEESEDVIRKLCEDIGKSS